MKRLAAHAFLAHRFAGLRRPLTIAYARLLLEDQRTVEAQLGPCPTANTFEDDDETQENVDTVYDAGEGIQYETTDGPDDDEIAALFDEAWYNQPDNERTWDGMTYDEIMSMQEEIIGAVPEGSDG